ncbi:MAG TPA: glycosyltransferase family 4 protein [Vicinamibacterales bacterium]|jgi:glycosyltransferase involved in cell wall biosynthesis|nr:glycosyltransferase family 4 protein [Vicinamibacterales bacterium]
MRIALIAPPFISVPPRKYGGTELFVAVLANALHAAGHDVVVYANGDSCVDCELKWKYRHSRWPIADPSMAPLENLDHTAWAMHDAAKSADVIHLNDPVGLPATPFVDRPVVLTLHHPLVPALSGFYDGYPLIQYVAISAAQARRERMPLIEVVHHGIPIEAYTFRAQKDDFVVFLGRMAPCKGAHRAIEAARRAGVRLKLAGEVQPVFQDYWDTQVLPHVDGRDVEYVGEADFDRKNDLLSRARACLFPIDWDEPFGLVMIESMACGTPVLATPGGSVPEVIRDGVSGWICGDVGAMAARLGSLDIPPAACRSWVERQFSADRMARDYADLYQRLVERPSRPDQAIADRRSHAAAIERLPAS